LRKPFESGDYAGYLRLLVELKPYIDRCLDEVLIMTDDMRRSERTGRLS
jgi:glycyl-tRNA synthetase beta subunit